MGSCSINGDDSPLNMYLNVFESESENDVTVNTV